MLRVTIELIPYGNEARKYVLGVMHVSNNGTGTSLSGNYTVDELHSVTDAASDWRYKVQEVPRMSGLGIFRFLQDLFEARSKIHPTITQVPQPPLVKGVK